MARAKKEVKALELKTNDEETQKEEIDVEKIKSELKDYITEEVRKENAEYIKTYYKEVLKPKKRKIVRQRILIILLILLYIVSFAFLVKDHYFDKYIIKIEEKLNIRREEKKESKEETKKEENNKEEENQKQAKEKEDQLNKLKEKYKDIFQNVIITTSNNYRQDFYDGKYSNSFYLSLGVELLSENDIIKEQDIITINADTLLDKVKQITNNSITNESFTYKDISFKYIKSFNTYILDKELTKDGTLIEREIVNIEEGSTIKIDTIEYYTKNGKRYNPVTDEEISNGTISNNKFVTFEFINDNNNYYLVK